MRRTRRRSSKSSAISKAEARDQRKRSGANDLVDVWRLADVDEALRHAALDQPGTDGDTAADGYPQIGGSHLIADVDAGRAAARGRVDVRTDVDSQRRPHTPRRPPPAPPR